MPLHCRSSPSGWFSALPRFGVISTIAECPSGVKMKFWTSGSVSLHNASFILLKRDEVIGLSAPRSEEHINFQPRLLHLHANISQRLAGLGAALACIRRSRWGWEDGRMDSSSYASSSKFGNSEVSQIQREI